MLPSQLVSLHDLKLQVKWREILFELRHNHIPKLFLSDFPNHDKRKQWVIILFLSLSDKLQALEGLQLFGVLIQSYFSPLVYFISGFGTMFVVILKNTNS